MKNVIGSIVLLAIAAGCMAGAPRGGTATPSMTAGPTVSPTQSATATAAPTPTASVAATPSPTDEGFERPPVASLTLPDGTAHPATVGSYSYRGTFADAPYWPTSGSMTRVELPGPEAALAVALPDGLQLVHWTARYAERDDHAAETVWPLGSGGSPDGEQPLDQAAFDGPPAGEWLLDVALTLPDDEGNVNYYWFVAVP